MEKMMSRPLTVLIIATAICTTMAFAVSTDEAKPFAGQDLHLRGSTVLTSQLSTGKHALVFENGATILIGGNTFSSERAVLWIERIQTDYEGRTFKQYEVKAYLEGNVDQRATRAPQASGLRTEEIEEYNGLLIGFYVRGKVFIEADEHGKGEVKDLDLYKRAWGKSLPLKDRFIVQEEAIVPGGPEVIEKPTVSETLTPATEESPAAEAASPEQEFEFRYPVHIAPGSEEKVILEWDETDKTAVLIGRIYAWQQKNEKGDLLELQADRAVVFLRESEGPAATQGVEELFSSADVKAIYLDGDVTLTEGKRTLKASEMYYDIVQNKAVAVKGEMRTFDVKRGVPVYVRAEKLRRYSEEKFGAEWVTVTTSEFYLPQISAVAAKVLITDHTSITDKKLEEGERLWHAEMKDVRFRYHRFTYLELPNFSADLERPDIPIKRISGGHDSKYGTRLETRWYFARLLGKDDPPGVESTFALDFFGKRGFGTGLEVDYQKEDYFGSMVSYIISDSGEDDLGRSEVRRNLEPDNNLRGRFSWRHRHYLPYNWQLTTGVSYLSDEYFMESFFRNEFMAGPEQETYIHLKRIEENWGISLLGKGRLNDFEDELEEMPSIQYHRTGQSLFDDIFTVYTDTFAGRLRQRINPEHSISFSQENFTLVTHRTEIDLPLKGLSGPLQGFNIVPFAAINLGYDDRSGFQKSLVNGSYTGRFGDDSIAIGEIGLRMATEIWKTYPNVKSRLWDLNGLRHIIRPEFNFVAYEETDTVVDQRDIIHVGLRQRFQTKRGPEGEQETVDWLKWNIDGVWVSDADHDAGTVGADRFMWNNPMTPLRTFAAPTIFNNDLISGLQSVESWGPRRNYISSDATWRVSDTTSILGGGYYDIASGVVQQADIGFSRLAWPNLTYYIGTRYLRRVEILGEQGSNAFTFAATYAIDPRYTLVASQQYDFDYGANIQSDITLIRKYHRMYWGITYSADTSLKRQAIMFSLWPQGLKEVTLGPRRYTDLGGRSGY